MTDLTTPLLQTLYQLNHHEGDNSSLSLWIHMQRQSLDAGALRAAADELEGRGWIEFLESNLKVAITPAGMLHLEKSQLVDRATIRAANESRYALLKALHRARDEHGAALPISIQDLRVQEVGMTAILRSFRLLEHTGDIEAVDFRKWRITPRGSDKVVRQQEHAARLHRFRNLQKLEGVSPQQRGHSLEDLLVEMARSEGWKATSRVRAPGQENDAIVERNERIYIVSSKWEQDKTQPHVLELLESRVRSRSIVSGGALVSMSGFTDNCIVEAGTKLSSALILLFGPQDIEMFFTRITTFSALVEAKLHEAVHRRKILVDGKVR